MYKLVSPLEFRVTATHVAYESESLLLPHSSSDISQSCCWSWERKTAIIKAVAFSPANKVSPLA